MATALVESLIAELVVVLVAAFVAFLADLFLLLASSLASCCRALSRSSSFDIFKAPFDDDEDAVVAALAAAFGFGRLFPKARLSGDFLLMMKALFETEETR